MDTLCRAAIRSDGDLPTPDRIARVERAAPAAVFVGAARWSSAGQEGFVARTAVAATVLSHSANSPSERATW